MKNGSIFWNFEHIELRLFFEIAEFFETRAVFEFLNFFESANIIWNLNIIRNFRTSLKRKIKGGCFKKKQEKKEKDTEKRKIYKNGK